MASASLATLQLSLTLVTRHPVGARWGPGDGWKCREITVTLDGEGGNPWEFAFEDVKILAVATHDEIKRKCASRQCGSAAVGVDQSEMAIRGNHKARDAVGVGITNITVLLR